MVVTCCLLFIGGCENRIDDLANETRVNRDLNVVVYFVPHADDEVIAYGPAILEDIASNKQVYLALISSGNDSVSREVLNGKYDRESSKFQMDGKPVKCHYHNIVHNPVKEGYQHFTKDAFSRIRADAFKVAAIELGVLESNIHTYNLHPPYKRNKVELLMNEWIVAYPNATFKTMSKHDVHHEHALLGDILSEYHANRKVLHVVYFRSLATELYGMYVNLFEEQKIRLRNATDRQRLEKAIDIYSLWDPANGHYAVGIHSVRHQFNKFLHDPKSVTITE